MFALLSTQGSMYVMSSYFTPKTLLKTGVLKSLEFRLLFSECFRMLY